MHVRRRGFSALLTGLVFAVLGASPARSQTASSTATVSGQVTDATNAAVVGAVIRLTDPTTNSSLTTRSNQAGRFIVVNVPSAAYDITINKQGFSTFKAAQQQVQVGQVLTINAR